MDLSKLCFSIPEVILQMEKSEQKCSAAKMLVSILQAWLVRLENIFLSWFFSWPFSSARSAQFSRPVILVETVLLMFSFTSECLVFP